MFGKIIGGVLFIKAQPGPGSSRLLQKSRMQRDRPSRAIKTYSDSRSRGADSKDHAALPGEPRACVRLHNDKFADRQCHRGHHVWLRCAEMAHEILRSRNHPPTGPESTCKPASIATISCSTCTIDDL